MASAIAFQLFDSLACTDFCQIFYLFAAHCEHVEKFPKGFAANLLNLGVAMT
jgi:hypothetical protein